MLIGNSDAKDPGLAAKQILDIALILPGQEGSHRFDIPPPSGSVGKTAEAPTKTTTAPPPEPSNSLIDFDEDHLKGPAAPTAQPSASIDLLGDDHDSSSTQHQTQKPGTTSFPSMKDLMQPLQPNPPS